jgi:glyoxylase-like metal-dependent hydrolase (beta-lactamase superfamily II)
MPLHHSFTLGSLRCHSLEGGSLSLDGGAMFGVVPKTLWSKQVQADERNRIRFAMRSLLVEHPDGLVLIETGLGNKEDVKFHEIYGVENAGTGGGTLLEDALAEVGFMPGDVKWVVNTHLHFDHAGGNTKAVAAGGREGGRAGEGSVRPSARPPATDRESFRVRLSFPNATCIVQKNELEYARHTNERTRASYLSHNFEPVAEAGRWRLLEGNGEILPGISARLTPGHVPWHQSILLTSGGETLIYLGDITPTRYHLPLVYIMGYDLEPLRSLETKRTLFADAIRGEWRLFFGHDHDVVMGRAVQEAKGIGLAEVVSSPTA